MCCTYEHACVPICRMLLQTDVRRSYPISYWTTPPYMSRRGTLEYSTSKYSFRAAECVQLSSSKVRSWCIMGDCYSSRLVAKIFPGHKTGSNIMRWITIILGKPYWPLIQIYHAFETCRMVRYIATDPAPKGPIFALLS